jgi:hypothetical protein
MSRGRWLDHQCRKPSVQRWGGYRAMGDRWQCKCGRIWVIVPWRDDFGKDRSWKIYADPNRDVHS